MRQVYFIVCGLLGAVGMAFGQTAAMFFPGPGFDCWIGSDGSPYYTHYIRCMADRDIPHEPVTENRVESLMESLHQELHGGSGASTERLFKSNIELVKEGGGIWNIRIHSYPADWSWNERMPEQLVRSVLCPSDAACPVMIRKY
ncbi:MAG: hypothetical protein M0P39_04960 [Rhodocyclaceae bacterium]|nr:hypothetical protein [Rhodocyclaceae bacterium]